MPDLTPPDCQGDPTCEQQEQDCIDTFNAEVSGCQSTQGSQQADCAATRDRELAECDQLSGDQATACRNTVNSVFAACMQQAQQEMDDCAASASTDELACFTQVSQNFLNSSRNTGRKYRPGKGDCLPCTLPDCAGFVQTCKDTINAIGVIIQSQRTSGTPSPADTLTEVESLVTDYLSSGG